jgi:hypothetical protein
VKKLFILFGVLVLIGVVAFADEGIVGKFVLKFDHDIDGRVVAETSINVEFRTTYNYISGFRADDPSKALMGTVYDTNPDTIVFFSGDSESMTIYIAKKDGHNWAGIFYNPLKNLAGDFILVQRK